MIPLVLTVLGALAVEVVGSSPCPAPAHVAAELARVAAASGGGEGDTPADGGPDGKRLTAEIQRIPAMHADPSGAGALVGASAAEAHLLITLATPDGKLLAQRGIAASGSCADLAAAAAVVIATWQGSLRPDLGPELPRKSSTAPWVASAGTPAPASTTTATTATTAGRDESVVAGTWPLEFGVAGLAAAAAGDLTPGLQLDATVGAFRWGLAPRLVGSIEAPHERALGPAPGKTLWTRSTIGFGFRQRYTLGPLAVDEQVHALAGWVRISGSGFDDNYVQSGWDVGAGVGLRVAWPQRWLAPFLGVGGCFWAGQKTVEVTGTTASTTLPRYDVLLALGVSMGSFR